MTSAGRGIASKRFPGGLHEPATIIKAQKTSILYIIVLSLQFVRNLILFPIGPVRILP